MERVFKYLFFSVFIIKAFESLCMTPHGDALYYHLVGPRYWLEWGWAEMAQEFLPFFQAGLFDYLYVIPNSIFGTSLKTQLSGQLLHFLCGQGLAALILIRSFQNKILAYGSGLLILTIAKSSSFFLYAKNDGVLAALTLLITTWLFQASQDFSPKSIRKIFFFIGLLPAIKMNGLLYALPLGLLFLYQRPKLDKYFFQGLGLSLVAFSPILIRNIYYLQSPFFPGLTNLWPGSIYPPFTELLQLQMGASLSGLKLIEQLKSLYLGKIIFLLVPFFIIKVKKYRKEILILHLAFIFYLILNGGILAERFFFPLYFIFCFFVSLSFQSFRFKYKNVLFLVLILIDSKIDHSISKVIKFSRIYLHASSEKEIINQISPLTKFWNFIPEKSQVLSDKISQVFYSPSGVRLYQYKVHPKAEVFDQCHSYQSFQDFDFIILYNDHSGPCAPLIKSNAQLLETAYDYSLYKI